VNFYQRQIYLWTRKNWLNFGSRPPSDLDLEVFLKGFSVLQDGIILQFGSFLWKNWLDFDVNFSTGVSLYRDAPVKVWKWSGLWITFTVTLVELCTTWMLFNDQILLLTTSFISSCIVSTTWKTCTEYDLLQVDNTAVHYAISWSLPVFHLCKKNFPLMPLSWIFSCCIFQLTYNHTDNSGKFAAA